MAPDSVDSGFLRSRPAGPLVVAGPNGAPAAPVSCAGVHINGHSITYGGALSSDPTHSWTMRVAQGLGARKVRHRGVGGTMITRAGVLPRVNATPGGGAHAILQDLTGNKPTAAGALESYGQPSDGIGAYILLHGRNDAADSAPAAAYKACMRAAMHRYLAAESTWESADAVFAYGGGASANVSTSDRNSGAGFRALQNTSTVTFTVPASVRAGSYLGIGFVREAGSAGLIDVRRNGVTVATVDLSSTGMVNLSSSPVASQHVQRIVVNPGDVILLTASSVTTRACFNYMGIEAMADVAPVIIVPLEHQEAGLAALMTQYDTARLELQAEFNYDPLNPIVVCPDFRSLAIQKPDAVHPNAESHRLMAKATLEAIPQVTYDRIAGASGVGSAWLQPVYNANFQPMYGALNYACSYQLGADGWLRWQGYWQKTTGVAFVDTDNPFTVHLRHRPRDPTETFAVATSAAGTAKMQIWQAGIIQMTYNGVLPATTTGWVSVAGVAYEVGRY